jgi:cell wall-associated NlpC family hydrolase
MIQKYLFQTWTEEKNCWWLVRDFYKNQLQIELPVYSVDLLEVNKRVSMFAKSLKKDWLRLPEPEINCVVAMGRKQEIIHVGIYVAKDKVLHLIEGFSGKIEKLQQLEKTYKTIRFYQYASPSL